VTVARRTEQHAGDLGGSGRPTGTRGPREIWCVGHAITDCLSEVGEDVIEELDLPRGAMTLIDAAGVDALEARLVGYTTISGGSAANTAVGAAAAGARVGFVGSVADDLLGVAYRSDLERAGVACRLSVVPGRQSEPGSSGLRSWRGSQTQVTGRCYVLVSADGERTMATHLGVAGAIDPGAIDPEEIARSKVVYLEGYLLDAAAAEGAVATILDAVAASPTTTLALSLSDPFVVTRHRDRIAALVADSVGLLFANEAELCELTGSSRLGDALSAVWHPGLVAAITRGADGVVIGQGSSHRLEVGELPAQAVDRVVDTTGAGDLFAAGMLAGLVTGLDPLESARLGTKAAAEVISHLGARPAPR